MNVARSPEPPPARPPVQDLPVGFRPFHRQAFLNYQMNRIHAEGYARAEDIEAAAAQIHGMADFSPAFARQVEIARSEGRLANAAFYQRAVEFFTPPGTPERTEAYARFIALFDEAFAAWGIERHEVPYRDGSLPASLLRAAPGTVRRGTVVLFGGFDSLIEEFFCIWQRLAADGFDVIAFDGPGQGGALARHGLPLQHDWEKPVAAILDHFAPHVATDAVTLIGMSMGGYWSLRAAAFEPRIARVVAWGTVYDWLVQLPRFLRPLVRWMARRRRFMNASIRFRMWLAPVLRHTIAQGLYLLGRKLGETGQPVEVVDWLLGMNAEHLHSARVKQDVLLMAGEKDAFQPPLLMAAQADALVNASSVTQRLFTEREHAAQHCQMGNLALATSSVSAWIADKTPA